MNKANLKGIILLSLALAFIIPIVAQMQSPAVSDAPVMVRTNTHPLSEKPQVKIVEQDVPKISPELEAKLVALLKTVGREAAALNVPENRVRYLSDAADLLWVHDEKTARNLFANAASELRGSMLSLDTFYQQREAGEIEDESLGGMFFGTRSGRGKFEIINNVRQNLLLTWAKHDGIASLALFRETQRSNYKEFGWSDGQFEAKLASVIAKSDPARALEIGERKLSKNDFDGMDDLIVDIYRKDAAKGAQLAGETLKKLKTVESPSTMYGVDPLNSLFNKAAEMATEESAASADKTPLLSEGDLRELAEAVVKKRFERLKESGYSYYYDDASETPERLKKYAPVSYARLEREMNAASMASSATNSSMNGTMINSNMGRVVVNSNVGIAMDNSNAMVATIDGIAAGQGRSARESAEQAQSTAVSKLMETATAPDAKISLEEVRKDLSAIRNHQQKLFALTQIVKSMAKRGDKDSAKSLLTDAADRQVAQPRKAMEMLQNLMLADAYSAVEPDRAFAIMESTIFEFNSVAAAFNRMIDFADVKEIADGEFNMGIIPKEALQFTDTIGLRQPLLNLANADFERTAALADKFDRPELRTEAKMLIVRTLLPPEKE